MENGNIDNKKEQFPSVKNNTNNLKTVHHKGRNLSPYHNQSTTHWKLLFPFDAASVQWSSLQPESQNEYL